MNALFAVFVLAAAFLLTTPARADVTDCRADAETVANGPVGQAFAAATFFAPGSPPEPLKLARACAGTACKVAYFATRSFRAASPEGYVPDTSYGTAADPEWRAASRTRGWKCNELFVVVFRAGTSAPSTSAAPTAHSLPADEIRPAASPRPTLFATAALTEGLDPTADAMRDARALRRRGLAESATGTAQGLEDAAAETLQMLGQIVVDRASAEAYRLIKEKLEELLSCDATGIDATTPRWPDPAFPATCGVLRPLRMQDIAASGSALFGALVRDGLSYLEAAVAARAPDALGGDAPGVFRVVDSVILPLVARPGLPEGGVRARAIMGAIDAYVDTIAPGVFRTEAERAVAAGVLASTRCTYEAATAEGAAGATSCAFAAYADLYAGTHPDTQAAARALAADLLAATSRGTSREKTDGRARALHAVDALFGAACTLVRGDPPVFGCAVATIPTKPGVPPSSPAPSYLESLALLQPLLDAALESDANALVAATARLFDRFATAGTAAARTRAFLLLGSLVQVATAPSTENDKTATAAHEQRTKALDSLTRDMSDRTARDGDDVWSLGGSLRAALGVRVGGASPAFFGPISLPLGVGLDHVARGRSAGFHLEISPFDLGQYVAYDNQANVKTPRLADAIAPSVTAAAGWGKSLPLVLGVTVGYSPTFQLRDGKDARGTFNAGAVLGVYVPLLDMN